MLCSAVEPGCTVTPNAPGDDLRDRVGVVRGRELAHPRAVAILGDELGRDL